MKPANTPSGDDCVIHIHSITITETEYPSFKVTEKKLVIGIEYLVFIGKYTLQIIWWDSWLYAYKEQEDIALYDLLSGSNGKGNRGFPNSKHQGFKSYFISCFDVHLP